MKRVLLTCCIAKWPLANLAITISYFWKALFSHLFGAANVFGLNSCALCLLTDHATDERPPLRQADGARWCCSKLHLLKHSQQRPCPAAPSPWGVPGERKGESRAGGAWESPSIPAAPGSGGNWNRVLLRMGCCIPSWKYQMAKGVRPGLCSHLHYWFNYFLSCAPGAASA